ncbi:hypothetical protein D3C75_1054520 [compost metagenome]
MHLAHHVALLDDADAVDGPLGLEFDQVDRHPLAAQRDGGAQPANPAAHDQYVAHSIHGIPHVLFLLFAAAWAAGISCALGTASRQRRALTNRVLGCDLSRGAIPQGCNCCSGTTSQPSTSR